MKATAKECMRFAFSVYCVWISIIYDLTVEMETQLAEKREGGYGIEN